MEKENCFGFKYLMLTMTPEKFSDFKDLRELSKVITKL